MVDIIKEILISEKEFTGTNYERFKKALSYIDNKLIDSDNDMYLIYNSLINISIITGSNIITFRKVNVKGYGFGNMYMNKDLIEDKLYQTIDQFNERKTTPVKFYSILLNKINQFFDKTERTSITLVANDNKIIKC